MHSPVVSSSWRPLLAVLLCGAATLSPLQAQTPAATPPPVVPDGKFPIGVWLQQSRNAARYHALGINVFVGLSGDPINAAQLDELTKSEMKLIVEQTPGTLAFKTSPVITAWMHGDEPDNAQEIPKDKGGGYGPPIAPEKVLADYKKMKEADPARPVMLNLGMAVAWDGWIGRGVRTDHPEDYALYAQAADIVSYDIYPVTFTMPQVAGKLEFVPRGVERLIEWAGPNRTVWNCIECTHIGNAKTKPTPAQVRSEVWMALIKGSRGLIYFVHQFAPSFIEPAVLEDAEMVTGITAINKQIQELAPVLLSPTVANAVHATGDFGGYPFITMVKRQGGSTYLFAANQSNKASAGSLLLSGVAEGTVAEVLGENRQVKIGANGKLDDAFETYGVHIYRITGK